MQLIKKAYLWNAFLPGVLCIGIAGFATYSMASAGAWFAPNGNPVPLAASDDPVRNGLRIIETRTVDAPRVQRLANEDPAVILLDDWAFTSKGTPSPYK